MVTRNHHVNEETFYCFFVNVGGAWIGGLKGVISLDSEIQQDHGLSVLNHIPRIVVVPFLVDVIIVIRKMLALMNFALIWLCEVKMVTFDFN